MAPVLDDDVVAAFARDGVACLRSVLDAGEVAAAADAIDAVLATPGPLAQVASGPGDPGAFVEDFCRRSASTMITSWSRKAGPGSTRRGIRTSPTTTSTAVA
jgi:hypothetical protein